MIKVVILVGSYYPNYSAVGRCMSNLATELVNRGVQVAVISEKNIFNQTSFENVFGQDIYRIETKDTHFRLNAMEKIGSGNSIYKILYFVKKIEGVIKVLLSPSSIDQKLVKEYLRVLNNLDFEPNVLLSACLPFEAVVASLEYKKTHPLCDVMPVLFDLFALNNSLQRFKANMYLKMKNNQDLERYMLQLSTKVFGLETWLRYINKYFLEEKRKFVTIEHPLILNTDSWGKMEFNHTNELNFVYTGVVDKYIRNPEYVLRFFDYFTKNEKAKIHFFSLGSSQYLIDHFSKLNSSIVSHGQVTGEQAHSAIKGADFLISIGNKNTIQTPSKIFEYFSVGHPIVHFSFDRNDPVITTLKKYPLSLVVMVGGDIKKQTDSLKQFIQETKGKKIIFNNLLKLFYDATPAFVVDQMGITKATKR